MSSHPIFLFSVCTAILAIILFLNNSASIGAQQQPSRKAKILPPCHFKALEDCYKPLFYFSHRPNTYGLAVDRREHALLCR